MRLWHELKYLTRKLNRRRAERELDEEIRAHLEMEARERISEGMAPEDAQQAARRAFGSVALAKENSRAIWGWSSLETLWKDLVYAARILRRNPGFTLVALLTLAFGVGANTAIFSVVNAVLLKPLPFNQPDRLVKVWPDKPFTSVSKAEFVEIRDNNRSFDDLAAYSGWSFTLTGGDEPAKLSGARATATFFSLLGVKAALGRIFLPEEDQPDCSHVVLLSYGLWQRRFGSDPNVIGQSLTIDSESYTVVGVLPADFNFPETQFPKFDLDLIVPAPLDPNEHNDFTAGYLNVMGRLKAGVTTEQAQADVATVAQNTRTKLSKTADEYGTRAAVTPLQKEMVGEVRLMLLVMLGAVGFVLLIACANVANLQLARTTARGREIAIRASLGAGRQRVMRQLLTESLLLSLLGGTAGVLLTFWGIKFLTSLLPADIPRLNEIKVDLPVLAFSLGVSVLTGILFGIAPALQSSKIDLQEALKEGGRTATTGAGRRLRNLLVVAEVAISLLLVVGAGLLIKSFWRLQQVDPGFEADKVLSLRLAPPSVAYAKPARKIAFYQQVIERIQSIPGVKAVGGNHLLPMGGSNWNPALRVEDHPLPPGEEPPLVDWRLVTSDYFQAMGIRLVRGRYFIAQDGEKAPPVAIVNETLARRYWPDEDPIGKRIRGGFESNNWVPIVGVVGDVKEQGLNLPTHLEMYRPYDQAPFPSSLTLMVCTDAEPTALAAVIRQEVWAVDKDVPVADIQPMTRVIYESVAKPRSTMLLLSVFAAIALILGAIGVYGVIAYSVNRRSHEMGVRMALGATSVDLLKLVLGQGMVLTLTGVVVGLVASLLLTRLMANLLFGVSATDALTFVVVSVFLTLVALFACYIPARRAAKVDPMVALRYE